MVVLAALGIVLSSVLYLVARKFAVKEDPRLDAVESELPGANCGGCGSAGCRDFAKKCVEAGSLEGCFCPVGGNEVMKKVAAVLGVEAVEQAPRVAVVRCNGSCANRPRTNVFEGYPSCRVQASLYRGETMCSYGCLGCGDCVEACPSGALSMNAGTLLPEVDSSKCTACGACVKACPRGIIELRAKGPVRVWVDCVNKDKGAVARKACSAACIGCGKCAKLCESSAITLQDNLAWIDSDKCAQCTKCVSECPTGAIHKSQEA